jgi:biotin transport system substrate-specific component
MSQQAVNAGALEHVRGGRRLAQVGAIVAGAALTALAARIAVPLPGTAVPFTLQVVAVMLTGVLLGSRGGAASQTLYLVAGLAGLPVFAAGGGAAYLFGPTGGYLLAFPVAAAVAGHFATHEQMAVRALGLVLAVAVIHLGGMAWLSVIAGADVAFATGVAPFLAGDVLKILLVLAVGTVLGGRSRQLFG